MKVERSEQREVLLDTHTFLWFDTNPEKLPEQVLSLLRNKDTNVAVSSITAWEFSIKHRLGKLPEAGELIQEYHQSLAHYGFRELPFTSVHALKEGDITHPHKDPFDRALAAQALSEQLPLVTRDRVFTELGVTVFWTD